jgi:YD repeat-containing protein
MTSVVTKASGGSVIKAVEYTYDVYDRRIAKSVDGNGSGPNTATQERFVYDGDDIALVFDGAGNQTSRYLHGPEVDQVLAEETAAGMRWALADHQGSVRDVINSSGTVLNHLTYDSYGQVTSETHPEVDFRFGYTGRERDEETGLITTEPGTLTQHQGHSSVKTRWGLGRAMQMFIGMCSIAPLTTLIQMGNLLLLRYPLYMSELDL